MAGIFLLVWGMVRVIPGWNVVDFALWLSDPGTLTVQWAGFCGGGVCVGVEGYVIRFRTEGEIQVEKSDSLFEKPLTCRPPNDKGYVFCSEGCGVAWTSSSDTLVLWVQQKGKWRRAWASPKGEAVSVTCGPDGSWALLVAEDTGWVLVESRGEGFTLRSAEWARSFREVHLVGSLRPGVWVGLLFDGFRTVGVLFKQGNTYVFSVPEQIRYFRGWQVVWSGDMDGDGDQDILVKGQSRYGEGASHALVLMRNRSAEIGKTLQRDIAALEKLAPWKLSRHISRIEYALHIAPWVAPEYASVLWHLRERALTFERYTRLIKKAVIFGVVFFLIFLMGFVLGMAWKRYEVLFLPPFEVLRDADFGWITHKLRKFNEILDQAGDNRDKIREYARSVEPIRRETYARLIRHARHFLLSTSPLRRWFLKFLWVLYVDLGMALRKAHPETLRKVFEKMESLREEYRKILRAYRKEIGEVLQEVRKRFEGEIRIEVVDQRPVPASMNLYLPHALTLQELLEQMIFNAQEADAEVVRIELSYEKGMICLRVEDDGKGLAPELLRLPPGERVHIMFQKGYSSKGKGRGGGLSPRLLKFIEEEMRGKIKVGPGGKGKGTAFTIWLHREVQLLM